MDVTSFGIVGSGSIGLYYGACLARAGFDVRFLLRSGMDEARTDGIRVFSKDQGDFTIARPQVFADTHSMGPVDVAIIGLKVTSNMLIPRLLPPLLGAETRILTLQNGLGSDACLADQFGARRVIGGLCFVCLTRETPASVHHAGHGTLTIGRYEAPRDDTLERIAAAFEKAGIETEVTDQLAEARWRKLVWNIPFNGLSITRGGIGVDQILKTPEYLAEARALMEETLRIAAALGHPIEEAWIDHQMQRTRSMGAYHPSSLVDFAAGRPVEVEAIWGEPLRQAGEAGVDVPHLATLYSDLKKVCLPETPAEGN